MIYRILLYNANIDNCSRSLQKDYQNKLETKREVVEVLTVYQTTLEKYQVGAGAYDVFKGKSKIKIKLFLTL